MHKTGRRLQSTTFLLRPRLRLLGLALIVSISTANAQDGQIVPTDDPVYWHLSTLQRRGYLLQLDPTTLPYRTDQIAAALKDCSLPPSGFLRTAHDYVRQRVLGRRYQHDAVQTDPDRPVVSGDLGGAATVVNTRRTDILRPLDDAIIPYQTGFGGFGIAAGGWIARVGLRHDGYYDRDPDALDSANRLLIRPENTYVGFTSTYADAVLGRFSNHWAPRNDGGVVVTDNPRPYDLIKLRVGTPKYFMEAIVGELDSATEDGQFTGRVGDRGLPNRRRFLAAHKFVWRPSPRFLIGIQEAVLYSGQAAGFSLKYLNPTMALVFEVDNTPKNDENNGMIGGLIWFQLGTTTVSGQVLLDDLDLRREGSVAEPLSVALNGSVTHAMKNRPVDFGARMELVTARTYSALQNEGQYVYLLRGIAAQYSDYVLFEPFVNLYADVLTPGLGIKATTTLLWKGEWDILRDFPSNSQDTILLGVVERTVMPGLAIHYAPDPHLWLNLRTGLNLTQNDNHSSGAKSSRLVFALNTGIRFALSGRK